MALAPGTRLGPYEVTAQIGAGGMGEVYRATDTHLGRDVAIKVFPDAFSHDANRLARFEREARTLAALNHPNIAAVYGLEKSAGTHALVMELVEGPTLADRIAQGALALDEAVPIAKQITDALEAAHEHGIIHRDLKPANIKVRPDGAVKVLDFGLAKAMEPAGPDALVSQSPTITTPAMTQLGMILGTAAYMAPEQAKGRQADRRSDVWAFGAVLYEMLTAKQAFGGEDVSDTLAFVLTRQPDWDALPAATPRAIRKLLRRCLEKDRKRRLADAADARLEIDEAMATPDEDSVATQSPASSSTLLRRSVLLGGSALVLGGLVGGVAMWNLRPAASSPAITRFALPLAEAQRFGESGSRMLGISRDGTRVAFVVGNRLYLRSMSDLEARPILGTEFQAGQVRAPVFSPDGQSIAFVKSLPAHIMRVAATGGAAVTICEGCGPLGAMSWDGTGIVFAQGGGPAVPVGFGGERARQGTSRIMRVAADGGEPQLLFNVADGTPFDVQMLPDGETVLFGLIGEISDLVSADAPRDAQIVAQSLRSGQRKTIIARGSAPRYLATGHIVYVREGVLFARRFDLGRLEAAGEEVPVVEGVRRPRFVGGSTTSAYFDVSDTGSLVYVPGPVTIGAQYDLGLLDPQTRVEPLKLTPNAYESPRVSQDGKWIAVGANDGRAANIWVYERSGASAIRQLTFIGKNRFPIWSPDGQFVTFQSDREGDLGLFRQRADGSGTAERLTKPETGAAHVPDGWSPDGSTLLFEVIKDSRRTLWALSVGDRKIAQVGDVRIEVFASGPIDATFSPNGRWFAYKSAAAGGGFTVAVEPFPPTGSKFGINSGLHPVWSRDGKTLFYRRPNTGEFLATPVTTGPVFSFGRPQQLPISFVERPSNSSVRNYDITPDGKFIGLVRAGQTLQDTAEQINVVLNWHEELKRRVPPN